MDNQSIYESGKIGGTIGGICGLVVGVGYGVYASSNFVESLDKRFNMDYWETLATEVVSYPIHAGVIGFGGYATGYLLGKVTGILSGIIASKKQDRKKDLTSKLDK